MPVRIASYNVHEFVGTDRKRSAERVLQVIHELRADIVLLQEVRNSPAGTGRTLTIDWFAGELDMHAFLGPTLLRDDAQYGNACLTTRAPDSWQAHELSAPGRERRGTLELCFGEDRGSLRLIATHLGLRRKERRQQYAKLSAIINAQTSPLTVMGGDFNDLRLPGWFVESTSGTCSRSRRATFPAQWPLFSLDRLHVWPPDCLARLYTARTPLSRVASDHLPLVAEIEPGASGRESSA